MAKATPAERLLLVIDNMRRVPVDELSHSDWHSLLKVFETLVRAVEPLAVSGPNVSPARKALLLAAQRASRDQLPGAALNDPANDR